MGLVIGTGGLHIGTSGGGASPVKRFDAEAEYIKRKAGGTDNIGTGKAKIPTLKGKSLVWNQPWGLPKTATSAGVQLTYDSSDGSYVLNGTASATGYFYMTSTNGYINGALPINHKGFIRFRFISGTYVAATGSNADIALNTSVSTERLKFNSVGSLAVIHTHGSSNTYPYVSFYSGDSFTNVKFSIECIDLTLMFGAGNEPSTVAEFEALYPLPYYEYNAGEIINNEAEAIETVGFNQWDEEWENGLLSSDGTIDRTFSQRIVSKNFIHILPSTTYYFYQGKSSGVAKGRMAYYDAGFNLVSYNSDGPVLNATFTTPPNAAYMKFNPSVGYGAVYLNDICINLSDAARNGQYEPYEKHTLQLGLNSFNVKDSENNVITVNGLKSAGTVYDEIDLARGKYIKRVAEVDLGTLRWNMNSGTTYSRFAAQNTSMANLPSGNNPGNILSSKYLTVGYNTGGGSVDKVISGVDKWLAITDSAYSDAATFKTAMSGVILYYELAEPVEYDLVNPIGDSYKVISGGTEERMPRDTASSVIAPVKYSVKYVQPKE